MTGIVKQWLNGWLYDHFIARVSVIGQWVWANPACLCLCLRPDAGSGGKLKCLHHRRCAGKQFLEMFFLLVGKNFSHLL